ncbi:UNVERIFIED_CONTAM: hypothetical protein PYX00_009038 [Menopon gallinae]|uniref:CN hydrolase domain-containing protein n=1 Tax=Menopon gallinae TaxID=328185 RepID=A0AAW2HA42_9NEOP
MGNIALLVIFTSLLQLSVQTMAGERKTYKAAVVEYHPELTTTENIKNYLTYIEKAGKEKADIILLPESTLTTTTNGSLVPHPSEKVIPYLNKTYIAHEAVRAMSEAAAKNKLYVLANVLERVECTNKTNCPPRGYFIYNTNIVFDRKGTVIARYRKFNVYDEKQDKPERDLSTFTTDFGVTFGTFICFDVLFKTPAIELVREKGVKHFLFSSFWYSEVPFLTASQVQAGWSYAMNATLLAVGANKPAIGTTGCGLYLGRGKSYRAMREIDMSVMLFFTVPIDGSSAELSDVYEFKYLRNTPGISPRTLNVMSDRSIPASTGKDLDMKAGSFDSEICDGVLCCRVTAKYRNSTIENLQNYKYRALAFQGIRCFGENNWHEVAYCGVVLCMGDHCAKKPPNDQYPLIFDEIKIEGLWKGKEAFQMPTTLVYKKDDNNHSLMDILDNDNFVFKSERTQGGEAANVSMKLLKKNIGNLISFGVYGRVFK